jgi:hypothetical protein
MSNSGQPPSLRWISGLTEFGGHPDMPRYTMHGSSIDAIFLATPCSFAQLLCQSDASAVRELDGTKAELQLWMSRAGAMLAQCFAAVSIPRWLGCARIWCSLR